MPHIMSNPGVAAGLTPGNGTHHLPCPFLERSSHYVQDIVEGCLLPQEELLQSPFNIQGHRQSMSRADVRLRQLQAGVGHSPGHLGESQAPYPPGRGQNANPAQTRGYERIPTRGIFLVAHIRSLRVNAPRKGDDDAFLQPTSSSVVEEPQWSSRTTAPCGLPGSSGRSSRPGTPCRPSSPNTGALAPAHGHAMIGPVLLIPHGLFKRLAQSHLQAPSEACQSLIYTLHKAGVHYSDFLRVPLDMMYIVPVIASKKIGILNSQLYGARNIEMTVNVHMEAKDMIFALSGIAPVLRNSPICRPNRRLLTTKP